MAGRTRKKIGLISMGGGVDFRSMVPESGITILKHYNERAVINDRERERVAKS